MAPVPLGLLGGGGGNSPGGRTPGVDRSSGAPIWRPPAPASEIGGGGSLAAVLVPSARGAPGALGLAEGSKASPRRPPPCGGRTRRAGGPRRAPRLFATGRLFLLQPLHLLLKLLIAILQLLDAAGEVANGRFQPAQSGDQIGLGHLCMRVGRQDAGDGGYNQE
jgi:hypothetical protein